MKKEKPIKEPFGTFDPKLLKIQAIKKALDPATYEKNLPKASEWLLFMIATYVLKEDKTHASVKKLMTTPKLAYLFTMLKLPEPMPPVSYKKKAGMATAFLYAICTRYHVVSVLEEYVLGIEEIDEQDFVALAKDVVGGDINLNDYLTIHHQNHGRIKYTLSVPELRTITGTGDTEYKARQMVHRKFLNYLSGSHKEVFAWYKKRNQNRSSPPKGGCPYLR